MAQTNQKIHGLVLSGGLSTRMERVDKCLIPVKGQAICKSAFEEVEAVCDSATLVSALRHHQFLGLPCFPDKSPGESPAYALLQAMNAFPADAWLVAAGDSLISGKELNLLLEQFTPEAQAVSFVDEHGPVPFPALIARSALPTLNERVNEGNFSLKGFLEALPTKFLPVPENPPVHFNTRDDLKKLPHPLVKITVDFFAILSEKTGTGQLTLFSPQELTGLKQFLTQTFPLLTNQTFRIAVNETIVKDNHPVLEGDRVSLLPPFAGG